MPPIVNTLQDAGKVWTFASDEIKAFFAERVYEEELASIRRTTPVTSTSKLFNQAITLTIYDTRTGGGNDGRRSVELIRVEDDESDDNRSLDLSRDPIDEYNPGPSGGRDIDLRFDPIQDETLGGSSRRGKRVVPSTVPVASERGRKEMRKNYGPQLEAAGQDYLTFGPDIAKADQERMLKIGKFWNTLPDKEGQEVWKKNLHCYKGFPMVESVRFLKHSNTWEGGREVDISNAHCYWTAVALLIYGNVRCWLRVKAEHLHLLEKILSNDRHPRHNYYKRLHRGTQEHGNQGEGSITMLEALKTRACWTNDQMCSLTADVYGVFVVLYKVNETYGDAFPTLKNTVYDMRTFGGFNTRHIFMCYTNEDHFSPMIPNDHFHVEFRLPRITLASTRKYHLVTAADERHAKQDGRNHYARFDPNVVSPLLARPRFTEADLHKVVGYEKYFEVAPALAPAPVPVPGAAQPPPGTSYSGGFNDSDFVEVVTPGRAHREAILGPAVPALPEGDDPAVIPSTNYDAGGFNDSELLDVDMPEQPEQPEVPSTNYETGGFNDSELLDVDMPEQPQQPAVPSTNYDTGGWDDTDLYDLAMPDQNPTTPKSAPGRDRPAGTPGTGLSNRSNVQDPLGVDLSQGKTTPSYVQPKDKGKGKDKTPAAAPPQNQTPSTNYFSDLADDDFESFITATPSHHANPRNPRQSQASSGTVIPSSHSRFQPPPRPGPAQRRSRSPESRPNPSERRRSRSPEKVTMKTSTGLKFNVPRRRDTFDHDLPAERPQFPPLAPGTNTAGPTGRPNPNLPPPSGQKEKRKRDSRSESPERGPSKKPNQLARWIGGLIKKH